MFCNAKVDGAMLCYHIHHFNENKVLKYQRPLFEINYIKMTLERLLQESFLRSCYPMKLQSFALTSFA